jgi:hypothetical protein
VWLKEKQCTQVISQWKTQRVYSFSAVFIIYSCGGPAVARKQKKRKCKNPPDSGREPKVSLFWKEAMWVLQLVNTPDIYNENKYQRRNLLLYHCLLDSGLRKFNVSRQLVDGQKFYCVTLFCAFKQYRLSYVAHTMAASVNQLITFYIVKPLFLKNRSDARGNFKNYRGVCIP